MTVTIEAIKTFNKHCEHYNSPKFSGGILMLLFCFKIFWKFTFFFNNLRVFALKMVANIKNVPFRKKKHYSGKLDKNASKLMIFYKNIFFSKESNGTITTKNMKLTFKKKHQDLSS